MFILYLYKVMFSSFSENYHLTFHSSHLGLLFFSTTPLYLHLGISVFVVFFIQIPCSKIFPSLICLYSGISSHVPTSEKSSIATPIPDPHQFLLVIVSAV